MRTFQTEANALYRAGEVAARIKWHEPWVPHVFDVRGPTEGGISGWTYELRLGPLVIHEQAVRIFVSGTDDVRYRFRFSGGIRGRVFRPVPLRPFRHVGMLATELVLRAQDYRFGARVFLEEVEAVGLPDDPPPDRKSDDRRLTY